MGLTLLPTAKTSVLIPDTLHSGAGAAAAHRGPLSASHHLSTIKEKQSEAASPLLFFEISEPKLQKLSDFRFFGAKFEKLNTSGPRITPTYSSTTLLLRSSCIAIAEQRQEFEARLKEQDLKIQEVNARFELRSFQYQRSPTVNKFESFAVATASRPSFL